MAIDVFDAHTLGGLDNSKRGLGTHILHVAGELTGIDDATAAAPCVYTVDADGNISASGGDSSGAEAADLVMTDGAGVIITVDNVDLDGTGVAPEGAVCTVKVSFGSAVETASTMEILGGYISCGFDLSGTVGSAAVDALTFGSLSALSGNSIEFNIAAPYEQEGGTQINIAAASVLKFSIVAFAKGGTI